MGTPSDAMPAHKIQSEGVVYLPDSGERAPMSIVWTTLPGISAVLPLIGHVGIADSKGVIYDFSGPYQVTVGSFMGGPAMRVWKLEPERIRNLNGMNNATEAYDAAVVNGACVYGRRFHNIVLDNCHCHVALVLNQLAYDGRTNWDQVRIFTNIWSNGRWVRRRSCVWVFGPCLIFVVVAIIVGVSVTITTR